MITTLLLAADRAATPWKNGGGVTREIAAWPRGASLDAFDWRISMAEVREPGAFSLFPQVDRWLTVIEGTLVLTFENGKPVFLDTLSDPLAFAGDRPCHGLTVGGPVLDLNLMVRRGRFDGRVERIENAAWRPTGDTTLLVALEPLAVGAETLNGFDALCFTEIDATEPAVLHVGGRAVAISLSPAA